MTAVTPRPMAELAAQLRIDSIAASTSAGSGHPTSSMSAADLMAVLLSRHLHYDWANPEDPRNDHLIFSKGHASPLLYAMFAAAGAISEDELINGFRRFGSRLQGHPTPVLPWVDVATGSLGQGLAYGVGVALAGRYLEHTAYQTWVLCGDGEMAEGSIWEALDKASYYRLGNLTAIVDVNRLGQRGPTELGWDLDTYRARVQAFGCRALQIDGHDLDAIDRALTECRSADRPTVLLAKTIKGAGFAEIADHNGWHGRPLPPDMADRAITELGGRRQPRITVHSPLPEAAVHGASPGRVTVPSGELHLPVYRVGEKVSTRKAYGAALTALGTAYGDVVCLDGDVSNSTYAQEFASAHPQRFFEMFIAEEQLIASTAGIAVRGYRPFASTFAAFLARAYDFIRMTGISGVDIRLCGSHAGTEIGPDGPSQMALEDLAALRAIHGSTVLYPADANATAHLVAAMAQTGGVVYLRATRGSYPVLYDADERFPIGGAKLLRSSTADQVSLIGAGVTVHHCLHAADELATGGITARVVDVYSVKPIDTPTLRAAAEQTDGRLVIVEDHYPQGGLAAAVLETLTEHRRTLQLAHLAVRDLPGSGTPAEVMDAVGITAPHIAAAARRLLDGTD